MQHFSTLLPRRSATILASVCCAVSLAHAQQIKPAITLAPTSEIAQGSASAGSDLAPAKTASQAVRQSYRAFARTKVNQPSDSQLLTLEFHTATTLSAISASNDFHVVGGTCRVGHDYSEVSGCNVEVSFTPQAPGHRGGVLSVAHSASVTPFLVPLGGQAYGPAISFIPSQMGTVPGTFTGTGSSAGGLLLTPQGLAIDGGDNLYIADTGNNVVRFRDSSGAISTLVGGGTKPALGYSGFGSGVKLNGPRGVATDYSGTVYVTDTGDNLVLIQYLDGIVNDFLGQGSAMDGCSYASPCSRYAEEISEPYSIAVDQSGNVFSTIVVGGSFPGFYLTEEDTLGSYYDLNTTAYNYYTTSSSIAVDPYSNIFYTYEDPASGLLSPKPLCYVLAQDRAYSIGLANGRFWTVAGSGTCGFSGDGGHATGAEISVKIGQFAFDAAGNFYFADSGNNRIRRVDALTGVIRTVAGNGANGYTGDGGPSTYAPLQAPAGIAVASTGRIYATGIGASAANPGNSNKSDVRMFGDIGDMSFPAQAISTRSAARTVLISNVGNDTMNFTRVALSSGDTADFAIDPNTTSCNFTAPLLSGHTCTIGFIFTPTASGSRAAVVNVLDDTVEGLDTIQLSGVGAAPAKGAITPSSLAFASQKDGTASTAKTITLSNSGGVALTVTSFTISGTNASEFTQTNNCGSSVAAGGSCTISVVFKPVSAGSRSASLAIVTSSGTLTASLTGTSTTAAQPRVMLSSVVNPAVSGQALELSSDVVAATQPTGHVQLREGGTILAVATLVKGHVTFPQVYLPAGVHVLTSLYVGDQEHAASSSTPVRQVVRPALEGTVDRAQAGTRSGSSISH